MKRPTNKIKITILAALAALMNYVAGCSMVGYGAGAAFDACTPDHRFVDKAKADNIKPDTPVTIYFRDGSKENGIIFAVDLESSSIILGNTEEYIVSESYKQIKLNHSTISDIITRHPGIKPSPKDYIDLEVVNLIEAPREKHGKAIGLSAGLMADLALLIMGLSDVFGPQGSSWLGN